MESTNAPMERKVRIRATATLCAGLVAVVFLVAACSGSPASPGVAATGGTTTTTDPSTAATGAGPTAAQKAELLDYSKCMQSHGIKDFPDPGANGTLSITAGQGSDLDPNNPLFSTAQKACAHLMPQPTPAQKAQAQQNGLKMAQCMRAHGIKDFPDPNSQGQLQLSGGPGSDLNPNNPLFAQAQNACNKYLPGGGKGASYKTSGGPPPGGSGGGGTGSGGSSGLVVG